MRSTMLIVNSPMIAVGSPMKITASAAPITIVYMSIPDFTFLALHPGSLSSKNRAQAEACDIGRIARDSLMGAHEGTGMSAPRCFAPIDVRDLAAGCKLGACCPGMLEVAIARIYRQFSPAIANHISSAGGSRPVGVPKTRGSIPLSRKSGRPATGKTPMKGPEN